MEKPSCLKIKIKFVQKMFSDKSILAQFICLNLSLTGSRRPVGVNVVDAADGGLRGDKVGLLTGRGI